MISLTALGNIIVFTGSGKLSWEQVLRYTSLRKKYISLYASLLKSDPDRVVIDDNMDVEEMDRELDIEIILQWRYIVFLFVTFVFLCVMHFILGNV